MIHGNALNRQERGRLARAVGGEQGPRGRAARFPAGSGGGVKRPRVCQLKRRPPRGHFAAILILTVCIRDCSRLVPQGPDAQGLLHSRAFPGLRLPVASLLACDTAKVLAALAG
jgi:hypothetical protein